MPKRNGGWPMRCPENRLFQFGDAERDAVALAPDIQFVIPRRIDGTWHRVFLAAGFGFQRVELCRFVIDTVADETEAPLFCLPVAPTERSGLRSVSRLMVDKITTVSKERLGERIGRLDDEDVVRLNRANLVFLGLA